MKKIKYIIIAIALTSTFNGFSQVVDFYSSVKYGMAIPLGNTKDYIDQTSFRGFNIEFGRFMSDDFSIGFLFGWNVFYQSFPKDTYTDDNISLTGKRYHYINAFPLMAVGRYQFMLGAKLSPYAGLGVGAQIVNRVTDMGMYTDQNKNWHLAASPEAGFLVQIGKEANFNLNLVYNHMFKAGGEQHAWLGINAGVIFIY